MEELTNRKYNILGMSSCRLDYVGFRGSNPNVGYKRWASLPYATLLEVENQIKQLYWTKDPVPEHDFLHLEICTLKYANPHIDPNNKLRSTGRDLYLNYQQFEMYMDNILSIIPINIKLIVHTCHNITLSDKAYDLIKNALIEKQYTKMLGGGGNTGEHPEIACESLTLDKKFKRREICEQYVCSYFSGTRSERTTVIKTSDVFKDWDSDRVFLHSKDKSKIDTFHYTEQAKHHIREQSIEHTKHLFI